MVSVSALTNQIAYFEKSIFKYIDSVIGKSNLNFEISYTILRKTISFFTSIFYFAIKSVKTSFILPLMNGYAAMHYNADLRCYAVINVDKSAGSIGGQVNAFHCSSTHYQ